MWPKLLGKLVYSIGMAMMTAYCAIWFYYFMQLFLNICFILLSWNDTLKITQLNRKKKKE